MLYGLCKRHLFEKAQDKFGIDILLSNLPEILALSVNQTKAVKLIRFFREETNILIEKLPILRDITFSATKGFIFVIKVYFISQVHVLKPLEFLYRKWIALFQKVTFRPWWNLFSPNFVYYFLFKLNREFIGMNTVYNFVLKQTYFLPRRTSPFYSRYSFQ